MIDIFINGRIRGLMVQAPELVPAPRRTRTSTQCRRPAMDLSLSHFSIRTHDLAACERFYCEALGLVVGPRPPFSFPGLWLYVGDTTAYANAAVHLIGIDDEAPEGLTQYLGDRDQAPPHGTGAVDHLAFFASDLAATLARLRARGVPCRERTVPSLGLHQVFVNDPNGVVIELNFPADEKAAPAA
jgi:catechol 2,3-dioxygenase-like lactoylglutathione lyase family enzyme